MMAQAKVEGIAPIVLQQIPYYLAPMHVNDERLSAIITEMAHEVGVNGFLIQQQAILRRPDSRPDLGSIRCPTAVIVGVDDQLTPVALAEEIVEGISDARLVCIPDAGHLSPLENPEAVTTALEEWLKD
jgi:pimeloyl-ACP methyl ester carboxylesterase